MTDPIPAAPVAVSLHTEKSPAGKSQVTTALDAIPPTGLLLLAIVAIQVGAGIATHLFPVLGPEGTVAYRIMFSALLLVFVARRRLDTLLRSLRQRWFLLCVFGVCVAAMNLFFYQSIARIPLGAAVTIEFIGPLGVAVFGSRKPSHFFWVSIAILGIVLLSPVSGGDLDTLGMVFAFLAGACWAAFVLIAKRLGGVMPGNDGLVLGMVIAAVIMLPFGIPVAGELFLNPFILAATIGVALLSTTIPFTLEFHALKRMTPRAYGVLISLEPAVAALVGAMLLGERIGLTGTIAVICVVSAAIGITYAERSTS